MMNALEFKKRELELRLEEIQVKRELNELELNELEACIHETQEVSVSNNNDRIDVPHAPLFLTYSQSSVSNVMRIANVYRDGSLSIFGKHNSKICPKKYNVKTLKWLKKKLPELARQQKTTHNFYDKLAERYSKKFLDHDSICRTTMEKLCYLVDSGLMDHWFVKYDDLKDPQTTFNGGRFA